MMCQTSPRRPPEPLDKPSGGLPQGYGLDWLRALALRTPSCPGIPDGPDIGGWREIAAVLRKDRRFHAETAHTPHQRDPRLPVNGRAIMYLLGGSIAGRRRLKLDRPPPSIGDNPTPWKV